MDREDLRAHCLSKKETTETYPFGSDVRVYKVLTKVFALVPVGSSVASISLKCEPTLAQLLRQTHKAVQPGYHLNKEHWNTITCDGTLTDDDIKGMIDHSYDEVIKGFTRKVREELLK